MKIITNIYYTMDFFTKHSTANNSLLKIIATFVFIALPFGGFLIGMQYQAVLDANLAKNSLTQERTMKGSNKVITWKTYTNTKYNYSINYPSDWIVREFPDTKTGAAFQPANKPVDYNNETIVVDVSQKVLSDPPVTSFEEYAKSAGTKEIQSYGAAASFEKIITDSGVVGYKATWYMGSPPMITNEKNTNVQGSNIKTASGPFAYFEIPTTFSRLLQVRGDKDKDTAVYNKMIKSVTFFDPASLSL